MFGRVWIWSQVDLFGSLRFFLLLWGIVSLCAGPCSLNAASSLLRNPESAVFDFFPDASHFQSHTAYISRSDQLKVEKDLRGPLSFSDLGQQSILVVFSNANVALGMIHVRSEIGPTGVIELAWAMDLDFTLTGMKVQRSRGTQVIFLSKPDFQKHLIGKDASQVLDLLVLDYSSLNPILISVPEKVADLAQKAIFCAAKSLLITQETFGKDLIRHRLVHSFYNAFPQTDRIEDFPTDFNILAPLKSQSAVMLPTPVMRGLQGFDDQGRCLGWVIFDRWRDHPSQPEIWWTLDSKWTVLDLRFFPADLLPLDLASWEPLKGKSILQYPTLLPNPPYQAHQHLERIVQNLETSHDH